MLDVGLVGALSKRKSWRTAYCGSETKEDRRGEIANSSQRGISRIVQVEE